MRRNAHKELPPYAGKSSQLEYRNDNSTHGQGGGKRPDHEAVDAASEGIDALIGLFETFIDLLEALVYPLLHSLKALVYARKSLQHQLALMLELFLHPHDPLPQLQLITHNSLRSSAIPPESDARSPQSRR